MSRAQNLLSDCLAVAGIHVNGTRPWDIAVHDDRFFGRVLAFGTLGLGESYMDGWWDCEALDEMCCRAIAARLEQRFVYSPRNLFALVPSLVVNRQTQRRSR